MNRQFGALMTELREATHKLQASRELLFEIESEVFTSNCSFARAYQRVLWRREHPETEGASNNSDRQEPNSHEANGGGIFDEFESFFADLDEEFAKAFGNQAPPGSSSSSPKHAKPTLVGLKDLYRAVVRRLHPDTNALMSPQKKEWWHQAQAAYQSGDVDQLQVILTLCEIEEHGTTAKTSVSLIMRITQQFKSSLRALKKQLTQSRHDPAWNFSNLRQKGPILDRTEAMLKGELFDLRRALEAIEAQLAAWARQAQSLRRRPQNRRYPQFW